MSLGNNRACLRFRDGDCAQWQASGLPANSVGWGAWGGSGMAAQDPALLARLRRQGFGAVDPQEGLAVLALHLSSASVPRPVAAGGIRFQPTPAVIASPLTWPDVLHASSGCRSQDGLYAEFMPLSAPQQQREAEEVTAWHRLNASTAIAMLSAPHDQRYARGPLEPPPSEVVAGAVLAIVCQVLGATIEPGQGLMEVRPVSVRQYPDTDPDLNPASDPDCRPLCTIASPCRGEAVKRHIHPQTRATLSPLVYRQISTSVLPPLLSGVLRLSNAARRGELLHLPCLLRVPDTLRWVLKLTIPTNQPAHPSLYVDIQSAAFCDPRRAPHGGLCHEAGRLTGLIISPRLRSVACILARN